MPNGLLKAHAYNLIEAKSTEQGRNLYKVRNVWRSESQWEGTLAQGSAEWTPEL